MAASVFERAVVAALIVGAVTAGGRPAWAVEPGDGKRARPQLVNVPVAQPAPSGRLAAAVDAGLGWTEALTDDDAAHQRVALSAAADFQATSWLDVALSFDGRYDRHGEDAEGADDGWLLQPELSLRGSWGAGQLGYGVELSGWLPPGPELGDSAAAVSADGRLMVTRRGDRSILSAFAGYRLDRSADASADASRLRFGDRVALGVSDHDAALAGVGFGYGLGRGLLFAEASARLLLGAEDLAASPVFVSLGVRQPLTEKGNLSWEASLTGLVSGRPDLSPGAELSPIEPRGFLALGLRFHGARDTASPVRSAPPAPARPAPAAAPVPVAAPSVELGLLDDRGQPLARARVTLLQGGRETPLLEAEPGRYRADAAAPGAARVRVEADGFQTIERDVSLVAGAPLRLDVRTQPALPPGQVRGLVRSQRGKALSARVRIEPSGAEARTDAEGFFQIDVPPGPYDVVIEADGYQPQRRAVTVEQQGVVIVNADLGQAP